MSIATDVQNAGAGTSSLEAKRLAELSRPDPYEAEFQQMLDDLLACSEDEADSEANEGGSQRVTQEAADTVKATEAADLDASPATALVAHYEFPETALFELDYEHLNSDALKQMLLDLVKELTPYHVIRDRYTAIACVMNRRGVCPPKFRPQRSLPRKEKDATDDDKLMMCDRQVIDMHWLHCGGKRDILPGKIFTNIFVENELDFCLAGQLASKGWSHAVKAEKVLNLIPQEQLQLTILREKSIADTWRNAERTAATTIEKRLREQAVITPSLKPHIEDFKNLWLAERMIGRGRGRLPLVAQMHAWISGKAPLATSTLSEKLKRMRNRTGSIGGRIKATSGQGDCT